MHSDRTQVGVCQGLERGRNGEQLLMDMGLPSGMMKMSWNYIGVVAVQHCEH